MYFFQINSNKNNSNYCNFVNLVCLDHSGSARQNSCEITKVHFQINNTCKELHKQDRHKQGFTSNEGQFKCFPLIHIWTASPPEEFSVPLSSSSSFSHYKTCSLRVLGIMSVTVWGAGESFNPVTTWGSCARVLLRCHGFFVKPIDYDRVPSFLWVCHCGGGGEGGGNRYYFFTLFTEAQRGGGGRRGEGSNSSIQRRRTRKRRRGGGGVVVRYTPTARHGGSVTLTVNTPSAFFLQRWTQFNFVNGCLDMSSTWRWVLFKKNSSFFTLLRKANRVFPLLWLFSCDTC